MTLYIEIPESTVVGDDEVFEITCYDKNGAIEDITNYSCTFTARDSAGTKLTLTTPAGVVITDGPNGLAEIRITPADYPAEWLSLTGHKVLDFELEIVGGGTTKTRIKGTWTLEEQLNAP